MICRRWSFYTIAILWANQIKHLLFHQVLNLQKLSEVNLLHAATFQKYSSSLLSNPLRWNVICNPMSGTSECHKSVEKVESSSGMSKLVGGKVEINYSSSEKIWKVFAIIVAIFPQAFFSLSPPNSVFSHSPFSISLFTSPSSHPSKLTFLHHMFSLLQGFLSAPKVWPQRVMMDALTTAVDLMARTVRRWCE